MKWGGGGGGGFITLVLVMFEDLMISKSGFSNDES